MALRHILLCLLAVLPLLPAGAADFALSPVQAERMEKFLPRTYPKLLKRAPVHVISVGDSVMLNYGYDEHNGNVLKAWEGIFLQELADQFVYNGGVRVVRPAKGQPEKLLDFYGPEITLQSFSRGGRQIFHALQPLTSVAFENRPDLVIVSYGINDSFGNLALSSYRRSLQEIVDVVKAQGADLILCGPSLTVDDPPERTLAQTRPYAETMREVAEGNGVFFADLGDLTWLLQFEERKHPLEELARKRAEAEAKAAAKAAQEAAAAQAALPVKGSGKTPPPLPAVPVKPDPVPVLQNPVAERASTDPEKKAIVSFEQVLELVRARFDHGATVDWIHPNTATQRILGRRVYLELINGPKPVPWKAGGAVFTLDRADHAVLSYRLENPTEKEQTYTLLPLVTGMWKPQDAPTHITLSPGKKAEVSISYGRTGEEDPAAMGRSDLFPSHEPYLRLPVLIVGSGLARIEDMRATVSPVIVLWKAGTSFNQTGSFTLEGWIWNTSDQPQEGKWEAGWMGQQVNGTFKTQARSQTPIQVKFNLPDAETGAFSIKGTLSLLVTAGEKTLRFDREVEAVRNLGLKQQVPMVTVSDLVRNKVAPVQVVDGTRPGVVFRADADSNVLFLTCDIYGMNLQDSGTGIPALTLEVNLDARSYGKRLGPGATDAIRVNMGASDGDGSVGPLTPWVFGNGYAMAYDPAEFKAKLTSRPDGARRLTLSIPRSYLYLHEWALGNGNSQLGLAVALGVWQPGNDAATAAGTVIYTLQHTGLSRDDAESLAALELTDKPTSRWTVRCY